MFQKELKRFKKTVEKSVHEFFHCTSFEMLDKLERLPNGEKSIEKDTMQYFASVLHGLRNLDLILNNGEKDDSRRR